MLYVCKECGGEMENMENVFLVCAECGHSIEIEDYDEEWEDLFELETPEVPEYCNICGGPFPSCCSSCKLFDD